MILPKQRASTPVVADKPIYLADLETRNTQTYYVSNATWFICVPPSGYECLEDERILIPWEVALSNFHAAGFKYEHDDGGFEMDAVRSVWILTHRKK